MWRHKKLRPSHNTWAARVEAAQLGAVRGVSLSTAVKLSMGMIHGYVLYTAICGHGVPYTTSNPYTRTRHNRKTHFWYIVYFSVENNSMEDAVDGSFWNVSPAITLERCAFCVLSASDAAPVLVQQHVMHLPTPLSTVHVVHNKRFNTQQGKHMVNTQRWSTVVTHTYQHVWNITHDFKKKHRHPLPPDTTASFGLYGNQVWWAWGPRILYSTITYCTTNTYDTTNPYYTTNTQ